MKKRLPILILLIAAGVGVYYWQSGSFNRKGNSIVVSGNLELTTVDLSFKTAGRMTELSVREGSLVKKGDVIARLDPVQLEQQKLRDRASISSAQSNYEQLQTAIAYQRATLEGDIAAKQAELAQAQAKLDELQAGSRPQEIQQAEAGLADARAQLQWARQDFDRAQTLYKNEDISRSQFDQAQTRLNSATAVTNQADQRLALVKEGPRKEEIAGARAQVARAQAALKLSEAVRIELQRKEQELTARRAEIDRARAQEGITQSQLSDTVIVAPIDGVVLVKSAEPGEVIAAGTTIVTIGDVQHPWLRAYINETDLGRVKLGQRVALKTDSYPGKTYEGIVTFISSEAEFTPKQIQTKEERVKMVYRVKIEVDNPQQELKNNMPVDAEIGL